MADDLAAVVMAGGLGTRMKSVTPKHLHPLLGRRMVDWVIGAARDAGVTRVVVVASPESADAFDLVWSFCAFEHARSPERLAAAMASAQPEFEKKFGADLISKIRASK